MSWGTRVDWKVGDRAKWFGSPGWPNGIVRPFTDERSRRLFHNMHVTIVEVRDTPSGRLPWRAVTDDGFEFNPSINLWHIVQASHPGWQHPDARGRRIRGYA